ncbi:hypothetical protein ABPG75_010775 [Micractinium tetrahymenae]
MASSGSSPPTSLPCWGLPCSRGAQHKVSQLVKGEVAGCYATDSVKKYLIDGFSFKDFVKGQWVKQAFVQAKARMRRQAQLDNPVLATGCDFDGIAPLHGCYNSIAPGTLKDPQVAGQYGFVASVQYVCPIPGGFETVTVKCSSRMNTLRDNRLLDPSFWVAPGATSPKDIFCEDPFPAYP